MLIQRFERFFYPKMSQETVCLPVFFANDKVDFTESFHRTKSDVVVIPDGSGDEKKFTGHNLFIFRKVRGNITTVRVEPGIIQDNIEVFITKGSATGVEEVLRYFVSFSVCGNAVIRVKLNIVEAQIIGAVFNLMSEILVRVN